MGTTTDKLNQVLETKSNIKSAIISKGVDVSDTDTFASYAIKIGEIVTGHAGEMINVSLKTNQLNHDDLIGATINISYGEISEDYTWEGSELTFEIPQYAIYTVSVTSVDGYYTPESVTYTAVSSNSRTIILEYLNFTVSTIRLDMTITDPSTMISGDVAGEAIQLIRSNSHRYLGKYTAEGEMTICQLDDTDSNKYADGTTATLTGEEGDVFVKLPKFYYQATEYSSNVWNISFAYGDEAPDGVWNTWDGNELIGAYEASSSNDKLYSISEVASRGSVSQSDFKSYSRNRGAGYSLVKWKHHSIMCFLFYAYYGNTNSQEICGSGTDSYTKSTGATNLLGMEDTTTSNGNSMSINYWGLENWWGNKFEWVDNVVNNTGTWIITEDDGSTRNVSPTTDNGYISQLVVGASLDAIPSSVSGGSETTGLCDSLYGSSDTVCVVARSCGHSDTSGGVAGVVSAYDSSYKAAYRGSRLAFHGSIVDETDTTLFKNISITN